MLTLRAAATLLEKADALASLEPIAFVVGCTEPSAPLDADTLRSLGIADVAHNARIAAGPGALRALMLELRATIAMRDLLPRIATRLTTRAPHVLWIVIAVQHETTDVAISAWPGDRRPPRVSALLADRDRIVDSDAETLRALAAAATPNGAPLRDLLVHSRWVEVLGRDALSIRFYRALERSVSAIAMSSERADDATRAELALLNASRLLFLAFLEAKGWLDGNPAFLVHQFENCLSRGGRFHERVLRPLFFGTLNTPLRKRARAARGFGRIPFLNGGLFSRTPLERRHRDVAFDDDALGGLIYDVFGRFRFTAREEAASWNEAAVDPEMLGHAFESLMASRERKHTGAFYTPFSLVAHVTEQGVGVLQLDDRAALERVTILDPACGSGGFLVYALERVARLLAQSGDARAVSDIRRDVLSRSIFGVDVNPTAVWLCELRLWLSVVIECDARDPMAIAPLPNLDRNIRVGDALAGGDLSTATSRSPILRKLRERYSRATGARKETLSRALDRAERARALEKFDDELTVIAAKRRDLVDVQRSRDLFGDIYRPTAAEKHTSVALRRRAAELRAARRRVAAGGALPFSFAVHFADVASRAGFALVVGNPPWIRLHRIPPQQRVAMRRDFEVARAGGWEHGANAAGAGRGFAAQIDAAALFVERSARLLAPGGALALLVPAKLWRSLAGGGVRRLLTSELEMLRIEDFSEAASAFDAAVYPSLVVARRGDGNSTHVTLAVHHRGHAPFTWSTPTPSLPFDGSLGAPWLLLPPQSRRAFNWLMDHGQPLGEGVFGRPRLGVKCGCNDAFLVDILKRDGELTEVRTSDGRVVSVESAMLRPLVRGESSRAWNASDSSDAILWTHDAADVPLRTLPPLSARWFGRWRHTLSQRADARHGTRWWSLFRTEAARFDLPRVVWGDVGRAPRAFVLEANDPRVPLNTCYVVRCRDIVDAHALAALLNGPVARAWLNALAEPARGGYRRYMGWTLALLPLPRAWASCRDHLAAMGERARRGCPPRDAELFDAALLAYGATQPELAPLVAWDAP